MTIQSFIETLFGYRISQDANIEAYLAKLSRLGKYDDKKKGELLSFVISRMIKIEDRLSFLEKNKTDLTSDSSNVVKLYRPEPKQDTEDLSKLKITQLWTMAKIKGIETKGKTKEQLIELLK